MNKFESLVLGIILAPAPILFCFVGAWFTSAMLGFSENIVSASALSGLGLGIIVSAIILKRLVRTAYTMSNKALIVLYGFYSILAFGFGMGIPVFNYALGIVAGVYTARKMCHIRASEKDCRWNIKKAAIFTATVMAIICCLMVLWGLAGNVDGKDFEILFESLLKLELTITVPRFWSIIFFGACAMILLQYWLTKLAAIITIKLSGKDFCG